MLAVFHECVAGSHFPWLLGQGFSNFNVHKNPLRAGKNVDSDSGSLEWDLGVCILIKLPSDA